MYPVSTSTLESADVSPCSNSPTKSIGFMRNPSSGDVGRCPYGGDVTARLSRFVDKSSGSLVTSLVGGLGRLQWFKDESMPAGIGG